MDWAHLNDILSAIASGFIIAGALVGIIAGIVRTVHWFRKRNL